MAKMTDSDIAAILLYQVGQAVGTSDSILSKERENVFNYYDGMKPVLLNEGDARYWSMDVYEGVEMARASLLDTFSANKRPVQFDQMNGESEVDAKFRTDYVTDVVFNQNPGFSILRDTLFDGLMCRIGVVQVWWDKRIETDYYDMSDTAQSELMSFLVDNPTAEIEEYETAEDGETIKRARLSIKKDRSQVRLAVVPPEQFGVAPMTESLETTPFCFRRSYKTNSELIKMGYPKKVVLNLQDNDRLWQSTDPEIIVRFHDTDDMISPRDQEVPTRARRVCTLYECYMELDINDTGVSQLYKVDMVGQTILAKQPVDRRPFVCFVPLPISHKLLGQNYAKGLIPIQTARTYLTRSIINHTLRTNNPRTMVLNGTVKNPNELMDNRIGGIVNTRRMDGIMPLPQAPLNPFVFQTIGMLADDREELTGISKLSQGLNKDAISKQNSQGMVNDLITVSQTRQKIIARNFAENFLRDLFTEIYKLVVENETEQKIVSVCGGPWQPVDFTKWPERTTLSVSFTLGYGEDEKEVNKWANFDKMMASDDELKLLYPLPKRYNVIKKIMEAAGERAIDNYILQPQQVPPPQPNPMQIAELQVKQADAKVKLANAQAAVANTQLQQQEVQQKATENLAKMNLETQKQQQTAELEKAKLAHKIAVDAAEIELEQQTMAQGKLNGEAAPTRS